MRTNLRLVSWPGLWGLGYEGAVCKFVSKLGHKSSCSDSSKKIINYLKGKRNINKRIAGGNGKTQSWMMVKIVCAWETGYWVLR